MRAWTRAFVFGLFCCLVLAAQDEAEFPKWMKATGGAMGNLRKMESKTGDEAVANAQKVATVYEQMEGYWAKRPDAADAVKLSQDGKTAALELVAAAKANDAEKAGAAFRTVSGTCKGCHDAHREKAADGSYKIK